jgi:phosphohistidine phosphatase
MHQIILLRHAKAAWPEGAQDHERPLAARGLDDAAAAARLIGTDVPMPDVVLCSPAVRTIQTWERVSTHLAPSPALRIEPVVYGADADEVITLLAQLPADTGTAWVVGHEPTMSRTALTLAGPGSDGPALVRVEHKYPTCGIAVLEVRHPWTALCPGSAALTSFTVPRAAP